MQEEIWKDITGYEGLYQVSNLGNIKSLERLVKSNKNNGYRVIKERQIKQCNNGYGYKIVNLWKNNKFKTKRVHRLIAEAFIPKIDNKIFINHKNSIRDDNRIENLEWCNHNENIQHAYLLGNKQQKKGEKHYISKLKNNEVLEIRRLYKLGYSNKYISELFSVNSGTISLIVNNKTWKSLIS